MICHRDSFDFDDDFKILFENVERKSIIDKKDKFKNAGALNVSPLINRGNPVSTPVGNDDSCSSATAVIEDDQYEDKAIDDGKKAAMAK